MKKNKQAYYTGSKSDHFDGMRFFNPWKPQHNSFMDFIRWRLISKRKGWSQVRQNQLFDLPPQRVEGDLLRVSFVGHSTMLIQTQGLNIITDPIWSKRTSPFKYLGPSRYSDPGVVFENLPPIDIILISHNHYDHLDIASICKIWNRDRPRIITPLGNDVCIHSKDNSIKVEVLDWYHEISIDENVKIHLMPSQHWSRRGLNDKNKALWGAFVIETTQGNIFFCGDSGYEKSLFSNILERFGSFRFAMLPIGAYEPRWFMKYAHMNPEEAVLAYKDLQEPFTAAIHFETFRLADEGFDDPRNHIRDACIVHKVDLNKFRALKVGESWMVPKRENDS
ncbi:MAG: MBL fold metallo-hydrolase [Parachlamydiaceae bacterium]|nr:MBL fold metallo-hydrolase [Parachlamydiaceae bacterium]